MAVTPATFRTHYPEFASTTTYPDAQVEYWIMVAGLLLRLEALLSIYDVATELFVAHNLALEAMAQKAAATGGIPGIGIGAVNNKSVDKVSIGYDTSIGLDPKAGHWNLTTYGMRLWRILRMFGARGIQLGIGVCSGYGSSAQAWYGPWYESFPNPSQ